jgi:L-threonylcarbamoyladenylate synthase
MNYNTTISNAIKQAADYLCKGELVAIPTETVYGLAADATNIDAIAKIYEVKNRPSFNPLILHVGHKNDIEKYAEIDDLSAKLIEAFMPGPFTILLPKKNTVNDVITAGSRLVAIRMPNHPLLTQLLQVLPFPLVAPSANISGYVSPTNAQHVFDGLQNKIPFILDGGACNIGLESTIVAVNEMGEIIMHRLGAITEAAILAVLSNVTIKKADDNKIASPGQLKSHYATTTPLIIGNINKLIETYKDKNIAILSFSESFCNVPPQNQYILSPTNNINEAASRLFGSMRFIDSLGYDAILTAYFPNDGIGMAINDRLNRAQAIYK